ncbi:MAG: DUF2752 domain-containing protein [Leptolyngbya sp. PLA3]|nr:MAG: DUF2752 domain-containing protein [Cyanobacteria bacterium CYA]MCE7968189.1 DUF2752 domain-containing protein [Leptolyngbya sp. PL-A3]
MKSGEELLSARGRRAAGLALLAGCLGVLSVASLLQASPDGHGTHTQMGLPACSWVQLWNFPCPTCGMTTAFAHAAQGRLLTALGTQPAGLFVALSLGVGFWAGLHALLTGTRVLEAGLGLLRPRVIAAGLLLFLGGWVYKMITWNG